MRTAGMLGFLMCMGMMTTARADDLMERARKTRFLLPPRTAGVPGQTERVARPPAARLRAGLPGPAIDRVVREHRGEALYCFERSLRDARAVGGMLAIAVEIDADGRVIGARASDAQAPGRLADCLERAVRRWQFPAAGAATTTTLAFAFAAEE